MILRNSRGPQGPRLPSILTAVGRKAHVCHRPSRGPQAHVCHRSLQLWAARPTSAIVSAVGRGPTSAIDPYSRGPQAHICHHLSHGPRAHVCHGSLQLWAAGPRLPLILTAAGRGAHVCRPLSRGPWAHVCPRSAGLARACKSTCASACIRTYARAPVHAREGTPMLGIAGVQPWARGPRPLAAVG